MCGNIHINHMIDAACTQQLRQLIGQGRVFVVQHLIRARLARDLGLGLRGNGGNHPRALGFGNLNGAVADRASTAGHQYSFACDRPGPHQRAMRSHGRHANAGARLKTGRFR